MKDFYVLYIQTNSLLTTIDGDSHLLSRLAVATIATNEVMGAGFSEGHVSGAYVDFTYLIIS